MRTGSEPATARSALRARLWLSIWGLIWAVFGTAVFALVGRPGWAAACGVLLLIVTVDLAMIVRHLHQGPHYQPGRDVPPYQPPDDDGPRYPRLSQRGPSYPRPPRHRHP
ncbi:hypothetical protein DV517_37100 [Streptomyces sp. S816]|uniref:DUF6343 family protein n=1 Tax=Streptomyces sp. S816 TaxID=2283197 RepID=UPI00109D092D|nr:DUF6343 family protein [Streptomyces sp. S816]TGZ18737.1 hypothetical protein DV517_37100 [Streptomyces sp. S816]